MPLTRRPGVTYTPRTVDTSAITLPEHLAALVDLLAENTHENWAAERIRSGWRYGPHRNDRLKEHPCLVPYASLPESEKNHDRIVVEELLKTILSLGFRIENTPP